jgi:hypothetical protein
VAKAKTNRDASLQSHWSPYLLYIESRQMTNIPF